MSSRNAPVRERVPREATVPLGARINKLSPPPDLARSLLLVAVRPTLLSLTATIAVVLVVMLTSGTDLTNAPGAIAASWLAAHQVSVTVGATTLGLLPLVPTALVLWFAGRECARAVPERPAPIELAWLAGATVAGPFVMTAVCAAVMGDAAGVTALEVPSLPRAFAWMVLLYLATAAVAIVARAGETVCALIPVELPEWVAPGARAARRTVLRVLGCALIAAVVSFCLHLSRVGGVYSHAHGIADVLGMTVLSLLYLPNVVVATASLLAGSPIQFGVGSVGLFDVTGAGLPALPALIPVPAGPAQAWWPVLLLVPVAIGVLAGVELGRSTDDRAGAPWATLTSAGLSTVMLTVLAVLASGQLGAVGWVGPDLLVLPALLMSWLGLGGFAGMVLARRFLTRTTPGAYDFYDDEYYEDDDDYAYSPSATSEYTPGATSNESDDTSTELDAELIDDINDAPEVSVAAPGSTSPPADDIVDVEVVEADLPEGGPVTGR
ncbi:cell division protein PerM [Nocardia camponoti]|uniref:Uncharacterized protein n=1 Tax=Nocardia camponoti TaxID=1616106 RepID=A0A917QH05_9NOCA|nr:DUF6350 family protein [Nocardia camponoti]GGK49441.1 hypothetical protein GCM10011591_21070 [Nocardia camponoti]